MRYICIRKEAIKQPKKNLNKMKNLNLILFFAVVTILVTGIHLLTPTQYR